MATIIFDFDDTLFDTQKFKRLIFSKLSKYGIKKKLIENSYKEICLNGDNYSIKKHIGLLNKKTNSKIPTKIFEWVDEITFSNFLFPDAVLILRKLYKKNNLILLTKGEKNFQNIKIRNSSIKKYFKKVYIVNDNKTSVIKKINLSGLIYFVNDKKNENKEITKNFPNIKIIEKKRGKPIWLPPLIF